MASYKNFSQKSQAKKNGAFDNGDSPLSYDNANIEKIEYEEWAKFLSYYRYYVDRFIIDCLKVKIYPFQNYIVRALTQYKEGMLICSRGLGKSWLTALFAIAMCILYPGLQVVIVGGNGKQARNVIIKKIKGDLANKPEIKREILFPISTSTEECSCKFRNGSAIYAVALGQGRDGDGARGERANLILVDEARLVKDSIISRIIEPMGKNKRNNLKEQQDMFPDKEFIERNKVVFMSSAYLKTCDLYKRFIMHYQKMITGSKDMFVCSLDYRVGEDCKMYDQGEIEKEKDKVTMTLEEFAYEYEGVFVGSSNESYYPYELTNKSRVLERCELFQPKDCKYDYVITHDIAVSGKNNSDNACTHVIKLIPKGDGSFKKDVIYTQTFNGSTSKEQANHLRELIHIKFPNTIKLIVDAASVGEGVLTELSNPWSYDLGSGNFQEYGPMIVDDDENLDKNIPDSYKNDMGENFIRGIRASEDFNNTYYPYMKACFENDTLRLLRNSVETDEDYKDGTYSLSQQVAHVDHDLLVQELSNIKQTFSQSQKLTYGRIIQKNKRDRATSLMYGLSYVCELEKDAKARLYKKDTDPMAYLMKYIY